MVEDLTTLVVDAPCRHVAVGFPGDMDSGIVLEPGNLAREGGIGTPVDAEIDAQWRGYHLEAALRAATGRDVRVVNDATLAALGASLGESRELVFTLGTGFGIALVVDGTLVRIRDVGAEVFADEETYDEALGEPSRARDAQRWQQLLHRAVADFVEEFDARIIHFGGGNARHVQARDFEDVAERVVVNDDLSTLRGALRLFVADVA